MNAEERAALLVRAVKDDLYTKISYETFHKIVLEQIKQAEQAAIADFIDKLVLCEIDNPAIVRVSKAAFEEGQREMREMASKVCDGYSQFRYSADTMVEAENMARDIRALPLATRRGEE